MKKFMRIALVFALAGATLVGCTKDYSGDISDLNKKVTEQASALSALQTQVGAAQTAADAAAQKAAEALAEAQKKASSADVQAAEERVNAKINDLVNGDVKALKDAVSALEGIKAGERLTDLETAIKDFVTKAEFAQELAALKDELEDAIAAGDKVNADAIAALEKKVEGILASLSINSVKVLDGYGEITAAYGKFTAAGVKNAAKWKGPKADEIAKIKRGDFVFGTGANEIIVQVNPADADITDAEISLQTSECVEAPIAFGTPYPFEGKLTKSENGLWALPFVVEEFTEEESKEIVNEFTGAEMALVVNGVRTDYNMSFEISDNVIADAPKDITEKVAEATGKGTFKFAPADAPKILDAYITGVKKEADSLRYDITYDGMSFTYDVEKVQKRVEATDKDVVITFVVSYMNLVGGTATKNVNLTIACKEADPVTTTIYQFASEAAHNAIASHGKNHAEIEASVAEQALVVDFKEFFDEFAPTKAEKELWLQDWKPAGFEFRKATYTNDELALGATVTGLVDDEESGFDATSSKFTIQFIQDYGTAEVARLDGMDRFAAVITFENENEDQIQAVVPFKINAPSVAEKTNWYTWNAEDQFADGILYTNTETGHIHTIDLGKHFDAAPGYEGVTLMTTFEKKFNGVDSLVCPKATIYTGITPVVSDSLKNKNNAEAKAYKGTEQYLSDLRTDLEALRWQAGGNLATQGARKVNNQVVSPYQYVLKEKVSTYTHKFTLTFDPGAQYADEYYNRTFTIKNLKVKAMGDRVFDIPDLNFQIEKTVEGVNTVTFAPALDLSRNADTFISLYNALYAPNEAPSTYFGTFTLKDKNGQALKLMNTGDDDDPDWGDVTVYTATALNDDDEPEYDNTESTLISMSTFDYKSQVNVNGAATPVGGLKIMNDGLDTLGHGVKKVYVKISIPAENVAYVLDNANYGSATETTYDVEFTINVK